MQQCWLLKLLGYNYKLVYRSWVHNTTPDTLSRCHDLLILMGLSQPIFDEVAEIQRACASDRESAQIKQDLQASQSAKHHFNLMDEHLYYRDRLFVPASFKWRQRILHKFHSTPQAGHT